MLCEESSRLFTSRPEGLHQDIMMLSQTVTMITHGAVDFCGQPLSRASAFWPDMQMSVRS